MSISRSNLLIQVIYFRFDDFWLESRCEGDFVSFREPSGELYAFFCKDYPPLDEFISRGNEMTIRFESDDKKEHIGFHLYYEFGKRHFASSQILPCHRLSRGGCISTFDYNSYETIRLLVGNHWCGDIIILTCNKLSCCRFTVIGIYK